MNDRLSGAALAHSALLKACRSDCRTNVDTVQLKAEVRNPRHRKHGLTKGYLPPMTDETYHGPDDVGNLVELAEADAKQNGRFKIFYLCAIERKLPLSVLREWMERNDSRLEHCIAEVPRHWRKLSMPDLRFPGQCFCRAVQFLRLFGPKNAQEHNAVYVIGTAVCGGVNQHGWVEIEDRIVFDGAQQQFYTKKGFYDSESATPLYRFTRPAVIALCRRQEVSENLYLWERLLDLPRAKALVHPVTVTLDMAKEILSKRGRRRA